MGHAGVTTTVSIPWDLIDVHVGVKTTDCSPVVDVKVQIRAGNRLKFSN